MKYTYFFKSGVHLFTFFNYVAVNMVRNRRRKTEQGLVSEATIREAVAHVIGGASMRNSAGCFGVKKSALFSYVIKARLTADLADIKFKPNYGCPQSF